MNEKQNKIKKTLNLGTTFNENYLKILKDVKFND